ncbi:MAG: methylmalonyl-CoA decarboxylase [Betaproteobacteria bacterium]|nr:methylmalonyl-CoA decarboxylase [Candidatus Dechloromonas phosphorivorans]
MSLIIVEISDRVGTITMNYEAKRNALAEQMVQEIADTLHDFERQGVRVVILRGQPGIKVWSSGHNVAELPLGGLDPLGWQDPLRMIIRRIESYPGPVIALVEGGVWGGACELVFACDLVIATPEATFAATPAKLGVPYNATGLLTFLNAAPPHIAKELLFTGRPMTAERLERHGIVNHTVAANDIGCFTREIAVTIAQNSPLAIGVMKEQLRILAGAHALSPEDFERIQGLRRVVYNSRDYAEGIEAFKEKRPPVYIGE